MFDFEEMMRMVIRNDEFEKKATEAEKVVVKIIDLLEGWEVNEARAILDTVNDALGCSIVHASDLKKHASAEAIRAYEDEKARQEGDGV